MNILEQFERGQLKTVLPDFEVGDTVEKNNVSGVIDDSADSYPCSTFGFRPAGETCLRAGPGITDRETDRTTIRKEQPWSPSSHHSPRPALCC